MLSFAKPSAAYITRFLEAQTPLDFTYSAVGATATEPPPDYVVDHTRVKVGEGELAFKAAVDALKHWEQFHLGWAEAYSPSTPIKVGSVVAILGHAVGMWWLNACRIVYVVDESGAVDRFGFGYGTLPGHAESGEERFLIEWDHADDCVWYDILAFSRPRHPLARIGYPVARRKQKRFGRESAAAMQRAVRTAAHYK